jgi:diguanylate cyclase (GGDEF)-like protein
MPPSLRGKGRRKISSANAIDEELTLDEEVKESGNSANEDLDNFAKEVVHQLIKDNLPPTPNNYSLYFDRLLENKSEAFKKQVHAILELEESNDAENTIVLEQNLKQGFVSVKNILSVTANLYKNMTLMAKILDKRKKELLEVADSLGVSTVAKALQQDVDKLNTILKKQSSQMKDLYEETGSIVKKVEQESIFDNKFGVYNKRYLFAKIEKEIELIKEFKHPSSLIMIELSKELRSTIHNEKVITLMTRTVARLLLKTSRRSDIIAHYGKGIFSMLLKHTDTESAKKASERLCDLIANSNFFLADKEIQLKVSIGITPIDPQHTVEETIVFCMEAIEKAYEEGNCYAVKQLESKENDS